MRRNANSGSSRGQTLSIFVLAITCLLGMSALAIDVGAWYLTKRRLQAATDHAALAGAGVIVNGVPAAQSMAIAQGKKNMSSAAFTVTTPYKGDVNRLQVVGRVKAPLFFASIFGFGDITITSSGAAQGYPPTKAAAVYSADPVCGEGHGLLVRVNSFTSTGTIHSDGTLDVQWSGSHGDVSYGGVNNCTPVAGNSGGGTIDYTPWGFPDAHQTSEFCPTPMPSGNITLSGAFAAGVYCTTGTITVSTGAHGSATMVANRIFISDHNIALTPFQNNVLAFATGTQKAPGSGAIDINGNNMSLSGELYAPDGRIIINGNTGTTVDAVIEGWQVELDGNNWALTGNGTTSPGKVPSLIE